MMLSYFAVVARVDSKVGNDAINVILASFSAIPSM